MHFNAFQFGTQKLCAKNSVVTKYQNSSTLRCARQAWLSVTWIPRFRVQAAVEVPQSLLPRGFERRRDVLPLLDPELRLAVLLAVSRLLRDPLGLLLPCALLLPVLEPAAASSA